jgi:NDP-sugar pyrophosphorylase family protein
MIQSAILLCGGKGERLRPLTENLPKPLIPLLGKALVEHLIDYLNVSGIHDFVLCTGYKAHLMDEFSKEKAKVGLKIRCVDSGDATMTKRMVDARKFLSGRSIVCYGDTLANVNLCGLLGSHEASRCLATITVHPYQCPFGIIDVGTNGRVIGFHEKPVLPYLINIGFIVCEPNAFDVIDDTTDMPEFLQKLSSAGGLNAYIHSGKHLTVNTEKERDSAEKDLPEFLTAPLIGGF